MAKFKNVYDAESDIPAEVKPFYILKDGKWVFNGDEFEGLAEQLNPGLASNKETILAEKKTAETQRDVFKSRAEAAEAKVKELDKPGTVAISEAENKDFQSYKALGAVKDLAEKVKKGDEAVEKVQSYESEKGLRLLAKDVGVDADALVDFKLNTVHGKDVELGKEKKKIKLSKNREEERWVLTVVKTDTVNGEEKKSNVDFEKYATDNHLPGYIVKGIFSGQIEEKVENTRRSKFKLPSTTIEKADDDEGKSKTKNKSEDEKKEENVYGNDRKMPWDKSNKD